jgi:hypothetical protein
MPERRPPIAVRRLKVHKRLTHNGQPICDNPRAIFVADDTAKVTCENCLQCLEDRASA